VWTWVIWWLDHQIHPSTHLTSGSRQARLSLTFSCVCVRLRKNNYILILIWIDSLDKPFETESSSFGQPSSYEICREWELIIFNLNGSSFGQPSSYEISRKQNKVWLFLILRAHILKTFFDWFRRNWLFLKNLSWERYTLSTLCQTS